MRIDDKSVKYIILQTLIIFNRLFEDIRILGILGVTLAFHAAANPEIGTFRYVSEHLDFPFVFVIFYMAIGGAISVVIGKRMSILGMTIANFGLLLYMFFTFLLVVDGNFDGISVTIRDLAIFFLAGSRILTKITADYAALILKNYNRNTDN